MKRAGLAVAVALAAGAGARSTANPLGQVLKLIDDLAAKVSAQGAAEEKAYQEFAAWCVDAERNKGFEIQSASSKKDGLEASISKFTAISQSAVTRIEEEAAAISANDADLKSATTIRQKEAQDFSVNEKELMGVIDTLGRAINVLSRQAAKNPAAFAQADTSNMAGVLQSLSALVDAAGFSSADRDRLTSLVQAQQGISDDLEDAGAPAAAAYKSKSGGIIDLLEDLKEKAEEQLASLRKAESNAKHNYDLLKQSLEDQLAADHKDLEEQKSAKATAEEGLATAEGNLAATIKDLADTQAALATAQQSCRQSKADHEVSVASREEELKVIAEAKSILTSSTAGAVEQSYSLLQQNQATEVKSSLHTRADLAGIEVVNMVKLLAKKHHSSALAQLASQISAVMRFGASTGEDPFAKVKALISDLINKLESEATGEATEKSYCDEQLSKTEAKKGDLDFDISKLTAKIDQATSASASLKDDVKEIQQELANLAKEQASMDKIRQETHASYAKAKSDLQQGLAGVRRALGLLRDYYGAASMLQDSGSADLDAPSAPGTHTKAGGAGSGIIGILEVCESDFAKNLATEEAQEDDAQAEYEKVTQENKVTVALKSQDVKYKTQEFTSIDKSIAELTSDRSSTDAELSAVLEYYAKIKERCIAKPEAYSERKERREAEIQGLREALTVLENETAFTQRKKRGLHFAFLAPSA